MDPPEAVAPIDTKFTPAAPTKSKLPPNPMRGTAEDDYRRLDWNLWGSIAKESPAKAYGSYLDKQFRVHRKGMMPITDAARLGPILTQTKFEIIDGKISSSNDLAFTYGKYATVNEPISETGYYVHVWRRDDAGYWKLVVDVQNPLPKAQQ